MVGTLGHLAVALAVFLAGHFILSSRGVRDPLVARIGERPFLGVYSLVAALTLIWAVWAYRTAPYAELWVAPTAVKHISLTVMIIVAIMVVASVSPNNPAVAGAPAPDLTRGPRGIFRITRHPFMWGVALWALVHLAANGDAASTLLFGALAALAILGTMHTDARKRRLLGPAWDAYAGQSSHLPFLAITRKRTSVAWAEIGWRPVVLGVILYLVLLALHEPVIGVAPLSLVAGLFG
jgi:uncharacterized membrane protein